MKIKISCLVLIMVLMTGFQQLFSQNVLILTDSTTFMGIGKKIYLFEDKSAELRLDDILKSNYQSQFKACTMEVPNLGTSHSALWCRMVLQNRSDKKWFIRIENTYLDTIQLFVKNGSGYKKTESGKNFAFSHREIKSANYIFPLELPMDSVITVYVRAKHHLLLVPLQIGQLKPMLEAESRYNFYFGLFFGIIGILLIANFVLYFSLRDISLIYFSIYSACYWLYYLGQKGFMIQWIPDSLVWFNPYSGIFIYCSLILAPLYVNTFLRLKQLKPLFYKINYFVIILGFLLMIIYLSGFFPLAATLIMIVGALDAAIVIYFAAVVYLEGYRSARFLIVSNGFLTLSILIYALQAKSLLTPNLITENALLIGTLFEIIFFMFASGDKANIIRKEREEAKLAALVSAEENERLLQDQNILLEQKVRDRTHELETEKRKSDDLLLNILPAEVAEEIKQQGSSKPKTFSMVTVMFTDFKDFTQVSEKVSAELLVAEIDYCFSAFDNIIQKHNLEKIKTIGDAYMCAGGMPVLTFTHAPDTINAAIEIRDFMLERKKEKEAKGEIPFELRIGIHTGPVVAGVVGVKKYVYDIWGDTVNIASRMENKSEAGKINISGSTYELVKDQYTFTHRGKIEAKNKGKIDMYFVECKT